jgi:hypothetical protein
MGNHQISIQLIYGHIMRNSVIDILKKTSQSKNLSLGKVLKYIYIIL